MNRRSTAVLVTLLATALFTAAPAVAQTKDEEAQADAAFRSGKSLLERGDAAGACPLFAESKKHSPGIGISLYLADCYQRIGKTASAWSEFRTAEALAREHKDKRADLARRRAQALAPALDRIVIQVAPALAGASVVIACDGSPVPDDTWAAGYPVDPGDHVLVARAGALQREYSVHVDNDNPKATVAIDRLAPDKPAPVEAAQADRTEPAAVTPATATTAEGPRIAGMDPTRFWVSAGLLGAGIAGIAVGSVFGIEAISDHNASNAGPCNAANQCTARGLSLRQDAINEARASTIAFSVGGAAIGACDIFNLAFPAKRSVTVGAAPTVGGARAVVSGRF
jgi:hypothetical protein